MKKIIAILLCALLLVAAAACKQPKQYEPSPAPVDGQTAEEAETPAETVPAPTFDNEPIELPEMPNLDEPVSGPISGGWQVAEDSVLTDEQKAIFEKALEGLVGVDYIPVACLGTQVVAGTNYCFLATATVVYPDAQPKLVLVYVYADLSGNAEIMNFADMPVAPNEYGSADPIDTEETLSGGWAYAEDPAITDEIRANLSKALEGITGAEYEPVANLGTQVVAGLNRCLLCKVTPVVPDAVPHYALVYVYENLEGGAEITDVLDFDFGALCTYGA